MTSPLTELLKATERPEPVIDAGVVGRWPPGDLDRFVRLGLLAETDPAASVACDACGRDHVEPVRWAREPGLPTRAFIGCPENGLTRLDPESLRRWVVRRPALADAVAGVLGTGHPANERVAGRVWRLGPVRSGGRVSVGWLAVGLGRTDAAAVIASVPELRAANAVVFVPAVTPAAVRAGDPPVVAPLTDLLSLGPDGLVVDRAVLDGAVAPVTRAAPKAPAVVFPSPAGTTWEQVELVVEDHRLVARVGEVARSFGFAEAGFEDRRRGGVPDEGWATLALLARLGGVLGTGDRITTKSRALKQKVSVLRGRLQALLGIDGDPFHPATRGRPYRARSTVRAATGTTFPTPPGADWDDLTLTEVAAGLIDVRISTENVGVVRGGSGGGDQNPGGVATVGGGESGGRYPLPALGLTSAGGSPCAAGEALSDLLRENGRVARPADDAAMLALGKALTNFFRLASPPFEFLPARGVWVARFDASSVVRRPVGNR